MNRVPLRPGSPRPGTSRVRWWWVLALVVLVPISGPRGGPAEGAEASADVRSGIRFVERDGRPLLLDAYLPHGPGPFPAALVIPGGKWVEGSRTQQTWLPSRLAGAGIAAFAIDYRPADEAPFPAQLADVQAGVRFLRANADRFRIDPDRIAAVGGSAGGHLAALLATAGDGPTDRGARVRVAVAFSGIYDLVPLLAAEDEVVRVAVRTLLGCSTGNACEGRALEASPIAQVDATDGAIYLGHSTQEIIPIDQARRMAAALEGSGVPHELIEAPTRSHALGAVENDKFFTPALAFLQRWIDATAAGPTLASPSDPDPSTSTERRASRDRGQAEGVKRPQGGVGGAPGRVVQPWVAAAALAAIAAAIGSVIAALSLARRIRREPALGATDDPEPSGGSAGDPIDPRPRERTPT